MIANEQIAIPGFQTDVHACSLMPTKSIQYCRRAAAIEDQQGTVPCEQLPLQAEETRLLSCKRKCQREEVIFSIPGQQQREKHAQVECKLSEIDVR